MILQCIAEVFLLWCKELVESVLQGRFTWTMANDDNKKALDAAKKKRTAAKLWLTRSVNAVEDLRNQLVGSVEQEIEEIDYTDALENLNKRLESWEEAQSQMECLIENVQDLEADIEVAADFLEMVLRRKLKLIKAWSRAKKETHVSEETVDVSCELSGPKDTSAGEVSDDCETPTCEENVMVEDVSGDKTAPVDVRKAPITIQNTSGVIQEVKCKDGSRQFVALCFDSGADWSWVSEHLRVSRIERKSVIYAELQLYIWSRDFCIGFVLLEEFVGSNFKFALESSSPLFIGLLFHFPWWEGWWEQFGGRFKSAWSALEYPSSTLELFRAIPSCE